MQRINYLKIKKCFSSRSALSLSTFKAFDISSTSSLLNCLQVHNEGDGCVNITPIDNAHVGVRVPNGDA